ncbi:MAG: nucleoside triphosphate pyrophosphohydrolase [Acidimicrobiia bacterium]|nr:nucleoside triphosphate pyrophosphohydrolase [Acidimicrobiia bacterium]
MSAARIVVVGLGPAGLDLLLPAARAEIERIPHRYARTARHPAVTELAAAGIEFSTFDAAYEAATDFASLYPTIAADLVARAWEHGEILYAVPGNPGVAEDSVTLIRAEAGIDLEVTVVPGLSFVDLAWSRIGRDPMAGIHVVDAAEFVPSAAGRSGPVLIGHCINHLVMSDLKLALLDSLAPETPVIVLQRLGAPDELVTEVALEDLDRVITPDHLTSVFADTGETSVAGDVARLVALARRLRGPGGCPWDADQTHHSLTRYLLEEAYETVEVLELLPDDAPAGDIDLDAYARVEDELGDLLFQVVFHSILAAEAGAFDLADVARGIHAKLVRRHPHVFGDVEAATADAVLANWEQIKKGERSSTSLVDGISPGLPSLLYAHKLYRKAASVGLDPDTDTDGFVRMAQALRELEIAAGAGQTETALGDLLAGAVVVARSRGVDAESSLRGWAARFRDQFVRMEQRAAAGGLELTAETGAQARQLWNDVEGESR